LISPKKTLFITGIGLVIALFVMASLGKSGLFGKALPPGQTTLTVAAASTLRFAFEEIGVLFEAETGIKVLFQFGSSGNLAQQISQGAPIDLYVSANDIFVESLMQDGHLLAGSEDLYAIGYIVLAVNEASGVKAESLEDLLSPDIETIALANPNHAPYGMAGKEALIKAGLWEQIQGKLVYGESVTQAMQYVQTGNAQAGIIALSLADMPGITYTMIGEELYSPLLQKLAIVTGSPHKENAEAFALFINGDIGRPIMEKYGFTMPEGSSQN
jgi:molybdate transport system substrate-binding protein